MLARPKSRIFTPPAEVRKTFSGLRSRWMMPFACAAASPSAIAVAIRRVSLSGSGAADSLRAKRFAFEQLGDDELRLPFAADIEHRHDVRMRERSDGAGLAPKSRQRRGIVRECGGENLDGDVAAEARVGGAIDLAHSSAADQLADLVRPEARAARERHGVSMRGFRARRALQRRLRAAVRRRRAPTA